MTWWREASWAGRTAIPSSHRWAMFADLVGREGEREIVRFVTRLPASPTTGGLP